MRPVRSRLLLALSLSVTLAACQSATASIPPSTSVPGSPEPSTDPTPIVITTDMGMDDLLAVYILLRDPRVDIRAITVDGTGLVHCGPGLRNMRRILVAFDRAEIPFACGRDDAGSDGIPFPEEWRASSDNMYGVVLPPVVGTEFPPDATELLADVIGDASAPVTIVALGPWTTLQDLFAASPGTLERVAGIHAMAGAIDVPGNMDLATIKPADGVEWNVGADPDSFADVMALDVPVTFVPLDATNDVPVPSDILAQLETDHAAAGADIAFETYVHSPYLATQGNYWWDSVAAVAFTDPALVTWEDATVSINERGRIARDPSGRAARIATGADTARVQAAVLAGLRAGAPRPEPLAMGGTLSVSWDGTSCRIEGEPPTSVGLTTVELRNTSSASVGLFAAGVRAPMTWPDALEWLVGADLGDEQLEIPDWIVEPEGEGAFAGPAGSATAMTDLPAGIVGVLCASGDWPALSLHDGGSFTLGG